MFSLIGIVAVAVLGYLAWKYYHKHKALVEADVKALKADIEKYRKAQEAPAPAEAPKA